MKRTGMTRPLDSLGRIVLPKELRMTMEIDIGDPLEFLLKTRHSCSVSTNQPTVFLRCG